MSDRFAVFSRRDHATDRAGASTAARRLLGDALQQLDVSVTGLDLNLPFEELSAGLLCKTGLYLSISHCRGAIVQCLASAPVGVDVEPLQQSRNWLGMAREFFLPTEAAWLEVLNSEDRRYQFIRAWVLKEAYIKLIRGSVFGGLNKLEVQGNSLIIRDLNVGLPRDPKAWICSTGDHLFGLISGYPTSRGTTGPTSQGDFTLNWEQLDVRFGEE